MDEIDVEVAQPVLAFAGTVPRSARGAALSMEYAVAAAARWPDKPVAGNAFSAEARREVIGSGLLERVNIRHQPRFDGQAPRRPCRVIVKTDARLLEGQCDDALGDPARPLQGDAFEKKVKALLGASIGAKDSENLLQAIANADRPRRIALLLDTAIRDKEAT
jgi:2-methylcitrate dehydratase PrpD